MSRSLLRTDKEIAEIFERQYKTVYRICFAYMKTAPDTEDAVQDTFIKLMKASPEFESSEHEKAWLIRTASNVCRNALKHWWRKRENLEDYHEIPAAEQMETDDVFTTVMELPDKYKSAVFLYYYEGYSSVEIAQILKKPQSTIRNYLHEARAILRERLGDDFHEKRSHH